jgi:probable F420-dependent oxidoreductase
MPDFGISMFPTDYAIQPVELALAAEERGFESIFFPEHTHIPASRKTPFPGGTELPKEYWHTHDPFVALGAAAAVTKNLKLGTGVCLVIERDPITLAKEVASLDMISGGRVVFGIGAGWNVEEMQNHGAVFKRRWKIVKEKILAMREIWTKEAAEFHGEFVNFDPIWSYSKPVQAGGPPSRVRSQSYARPSSARGARIFRSRCSALGPTRSTSSASSISVSDGSSSRCHRRARRRCCHCSTNTRN